MKTIIEIFHQYWDYQLLYSSEIVLDRLDWNDFIKIASMMNIKSCGTAIERRILSKNGWLKIKGRASHGDGIKPDGSIIEIKSSIISPLKGSGITFRGIRPYHDISEHYFILIDISDYRNKITTNMFRLTARDIHTEINEYRTLRPYNMKIADRNKNTLSELGTSFKKGDLKRWIEKYTISLEL